MSSTDSSPAFVPLKGHCYCEKTAYTMNAPPILTECCHCYNCQARSGSAFATNVMVEIDQVKVTPSSQAPKVVKKDNAVNGDPDTASQIFSCESCGTVLWAMHPVWLKGIACVTGGTLENADKIVKPDAHFFVRSKHAWITLPEGVQVFEAFPPYGQNIFGEEGGKRVALAAQKAQEAKEVTKK